jgi:gamma-tubulin complex component 2
LVQLIMDDYNLLGALRLMKRYFLMEYGDFFVNFLDYAEDELLKDVTHLSRARIQHWMDSCRQVLDHRCDEDNEETRQNNICTTDSLRCRFSHDGLTDHLDKLHAASGGIDTQEAWTPMRHTYGGTLASTKSELTGLDTFYLDFASIPFPVSIVLSASAMECYHLLFRHLFFAKYVERRLVSIWKDHQMMKELQSLRGPMGATFLLRQRMLHLLQNLIYYMMFEVIEPNWLAMEKSIGSPDSSKEQTVDDILQDHGQFLHRVLEACLLTNRDLVRALTKLLKTCLLFSEQMKRFMKATKIEDERNAVATEMQREVQHNLNSRFAKRSTKATTKQLLETINYNRDERRQRVQRQSARVEREVSAEPYRRMVTRFEEVFTKNLRDFMVQLTSSDDIFHTHKVNLCIRLDYNGYITSSLGLV